MVIIETVKLDAFREHVRSFLVYAVGDFRSYSLLPVSKAFAQWSTQTLLFCVHRQISTHSYRGEQSPVAMLPILDKMVSVIVAAMDFILVLDKTLHIELFLFVLIPVLYCAERLGTKTQPNTQTRQSHSYRIIRIAIYLLRIAALYSSFLTSAWFNLTPDKPQYAPADESIVLWHLKLLGTTLAVTATLQAVAHIILKLVEVLVRLSEKKGWSLARTAHGVLWSRLLVSLTIVIMSSSVPRIALEISAKMTFLVACVTIGCCCVADIEGLSTTKCIFNEVDMLERKLSEDCHQDSAEENV